MSIKIAFWARKVIGIFEKWVPCLSTDFGDFVSLFSCHLFFNSLLSVGYHDGTISLTFDKLPTAYD